MDRWLDTSHRRMTMSAVVVEVDMDVDDEVVVDVVAQVVTTKEAVVVVVQAKTYWQVVLPLMVM